MRIVELSTLCLVLISTCARLANVFKNMFVETYSFNKMSKTFKGNVTPQEVLFGEVGKLQTLLASHLIRTVIYSCSKIYLGLFHLFSKR